MTNSIETFIAQRAQQWTNFTADEPAEAVAATTTPIRQTVIAAMHAHQCDHYVRRTGIAPLCQAVAERLAAKDLVVDPEEGVVSTGGITESRYVALAALASGKPIYVIADQVGRYQAIADLIEATLVPLAPEKALLQVDGGILLVTPSTSLSPEFIGQVTKWATENEITVIADESDLPLLAETSAVHPFATLPDMATRTLTLGSFPDAPGLQAWQAAWFAGPKPLVDKVAKLKQAMTICSPAAGQYAALAAMEA